MWRFCNPLARHIARVYRPGMARIYKRGLVYWAEGTDGKRRSLRTRDRGVAQQRAVESPTPDMARQSPTHPKGPVPPSSAAPDPDPRPAPATPQVDFAAAVSRGDDPPPNTHDAAPVSGVVVDDDADAALAVALATQIATLSAVVVGFGCRYLGYTSLLPDPASLAALAAAWTPQAGVWIRNGQISTWTMILGATAHLALGMVGAPIPPTEPVAKANSEAGTGVK